MKKKKIVQIVAGTALGCVLVGGCVAASIYSITEEVKTESYYCQSVSTVYNDSKYYLSNLYELTNQETNETYICELRPDFSGQLGWSLGSEGIRFGINSVRGTDCYFDLDTDEIIALEGFEDKMGYEAKELLSSFPYEEYGGSKGRVEIPEDEFKKVLDINSDNRSRQLK